MKIMNVKQLFLLSTLCLTMGTTQAPAQGFLNKLKNKGAKLVKQAMPDAVKDVVNTVEKTEGEASKTRNRVESKVRNRTRMQGNSTMAGGGVTLSPKKKEITIKLCRGLGPSTWYGRKNARSPQPPVCSKQDSWYRSLPFIHDMDNASLVAESQMLKQWIRSNSSETCSPVVVRREENTREMGERIRALDNAVRYLNGSVEEMPEVLESGAFKRAMQSDCSPLYPSLESETVTYLKSINRTTKEVTVTVYEGNSAYDNKMNIDEMWFEVNPSERTAKLLEMDDESAGKDYTVPSSIRFAGHLFRVTEIGASAFSEKKVKSVTLPMGLKSIGDNAFMSSTISEISIPATVTNIGKGAFSNIPTLKTISVPNSVKTIGHSCFVACTGLTEVKLPARLEKLWNNMFSGCRSLTKVTLPQNIDKIDTGTFEDCKALAHIDLPQSVTTIGVNAFKNTALTEVPVTTSLKLIDSNAFEGCNGLTSVSLPASVQIETEAFKNCKNLRKATISAEHRGIPDDIYMIFMGCPFAQKPLTSVPSCVTFSE
ncbi:leucine-rich repeat domain-containing protein [Prevotella brevis]|nr:leucine-rich repeat domain-containing protein [Xylanibacter brevis]